MTASVLLTGCFDVLHVGHIHLINYALTISPILYICIDSDKKVKADKGNSRPFNNENDRKYFLTNIKGVDRVLIFNTTKELEDICEIIKPTYRIVGSDWKNKTIVGEKFCENVLYFDRIPGYSTTNILESKVNAI